MLTWLRDQVLALWSKVNSAFSYAYNIASSLASNALSAAKAWAASAIDSARAALSSAIDAARTYAASLYASAQSTIATVRTYLIGLINDAAAAVRSFAQSLYNAAIGAVETAKAYLRGLLNGATDALRSWVTGLVGGIVTAWEVWKSGLAALLAWYRDEFPAGWAFLKGLMALLTAANLGALTDFLGRMYAWLVGFLADPLGYVATFVQSFFVDMLCDLLAHGLGTVKYDLPPRKTYGKGGSGGFLPGGPGPPPGASGLANPVSPVYVSGYTFGPGHYGIDLGISDGQAIYAMHSGTVLTAGWSTVGYGNTMVLEGGGWWSRYAHLKALGFKVGDHVSQSQQIANGDTTGNSTGNHLHLELKYNGSWVDPATVLSV